MNCCKVWYVESFTVYGQATEFNLTFFREKLHIVWHDPRIDDQTSSMAMSSVS